MEALAAADRGGAGRGGSPAQHRGPQRCARAPARGPDRRRSRRSRASCRNGSSWSRTASPSSPTRAAGRRPAGSTTSATNRRFAAGLARGQAVLDLYSYCGGFALTAAAGGATSGDRGRQLRLGAGARGRQCRPAGQSPTGSASSGPRRSPSSTRPPPAKTRYGLVIADPPAFVKSRKDLGAGLKGYRKLARHGGRRRDRARLPVPRLLLAPCHRRAVRGRGLGGIREAGRGGRLIRSAGAGPDHPIHPALPETAYLKFLAYALD